MPKKYSFPKMPASPLNSTPDELIYEEIAASSSDSYESLGCPQCGHCEHRNIHKEQWGVCPEHRTKWALGYNSSTYFNEPPAVWYQNMLNLADYHEVTPALFIPKPKRSRTKRYKAL